MKIPNFFLVIITMLLSFALTTCENSFVKEMHEQVDSYKSSVGPRITMESGGSTISTGSIVLVTGTSIGNPSTITIIIGNNGEEVLHIDLDPDVNDPNNDFSLETGLLDFNINPEDSQSFSVLFDPGTTGTKSAELTISSNDEINPTFSFTIQAEATPETISDIEVRDTQEWNIIPGDLSQDYDFGNVDVNSSLSKDFTIRNLGSIDLEISGPPLITVSGTDASMFVVLNNPLATILPSESTEFTLRFYPTSRGLKSAKISILSNDPDESPYEFNVNGISLEADIQVTGTTSFGNVYADGTNGVASSYATHTIYNDGNDPLTVIGIVFSGGNSGDFDLYNLPSLPKVIAASGTSTFQVRFDPVATGVRSTTVVINSDDPDENPYTYSVSGTGTAPEIAVTGDSTFGNIIQKTSRDHIFTISNSGTYTLSLTGNPLVAISGSSDFTIHSQPATSSIGTSSSTTFTVRFLPSSIGAKSATISIDNNDSNENPYAIAISGSGESFHGSKTIYTGTIGHADVESYGNTIHISFYDGYGDDLEYMVSNDGGSTFSQQTLASTGDQGYTHDLSLDYYGNPYICFYDRSGYDLELAYLSTWFKFSTQDSIGNVGYFCSMDTYASSSYEYHYIAYNDSTNGDLKFRRVNSEAGLQTSSVIDNTAGTSVGHSTSVAVDNANMNRVYVAYQDYSYANLKFATSTNAGSSWSTPLTLTSTGDVGSSTSIDCNGGNVYIAYRDLSTSQVKMIRSTNYGVSWGSPVAVVSSTYPGNIRVVASTLYLPYYKSGTGIVLAKSTNSGSSWTETLVDSQGFATSSLSIYGTTMTMVYMDTNSDLRISRSLDGGVTWD